MLNRTGENFSVCVDDSEKNKKSSLRLATRRRVPARQNFPWQKKLKLMQTAHLGNLDKRSCLQRFSIFAFE